MISAIFIERVNVGGQRAFCVRDKASKEAKVQLKCSCRRLAASTTGNTNYHRYHAVLVDQPYPIVLG